MTYQPTYVRLDKKGRTDEVYLHPLSSSPLLSMRCMYTSHLPLSLSCSSPEWTPRALRRLLPHWGLLTHPSLSLSSRVTYTWRLLFFSRHLCPLLLLTAERKIPGVPTPGIFPSLRQVNVHLILLEKEGLKRGLFGTLFCFLLKFHTSLSARVEAKPPCVSRSRRQTFFSKHLSFSRDTSPAPLCRCL